MKATAERLEANDAPESAPDLVRELVAGVRVLPDEEVDARERADRANDALRIRDRMPRAFREQKALDRLSKACHPKLAEAARTWTRRNGSLLLLGDTGAGKSTAAAFVLRRVLGAGVQRGGVAWDIAKAVQWFHATELMVSRQQHPLGKGEAPEIAAACRASILVIDDIGKDIDPKGVAEVIASRYDDVLPTIFTSNLGFPEEIAAHYGEANARKMVELGGREPLIVDLTGRRA